MMTTTETDRENIEALFGDGGNDEC
jgi:hypothetical protein